MLNLQILESPILAVQPALLPFQLLFVISGRIVSWFSHILSYETVSLQQCLVKWETALAFYFNECKVAVNAQKRYFQEQLIRNEISKYKKIFAIILGSV